jgi:hypothetical protein
MVAAANTPVAGQHSHGQPLPDVLAGMAMR